MAFDKLLCYKNRSQDEFEFIQQNLVVRTDCFSPEEEDFFRERSQLRINSLITPLCSVREEQYNCSCSSAESSWISSTNSTGELAPASDQTIDAIARLSSPYHQWEAIQQKLNSSKPCPVRPSPRQRSNHAVLIDPLDMELVVSAQQRGHRSRDNADWFDDVSSVSSDSVGP